MTPIVTVTAYAVSCLPDDHPDWRYYRLAVRRHGVRWVVEDGGEYLRIDGTWTTVPHLYETAEKALEVAQEYAPTMQLNGRTVADVLGGAR